MARESRLQVAFDPTMHCNSTSALEAYQGTDGHQKWTFPEAWPCAAPLASAAVHPSASDGATRTMVVGATSLDDSSYWLVE